MFATPTPNVFPIRPNCRFDKQNVKGGNGTLYVPARNNKVSILCDGQVDNFNQFTSLQKQFYLTDNTFSH